jgi:ABC-2 type transport system permease protein
VNAITNYSQMSSSRLLAAYLGDIRFEFVKMLRTPAFAMPTLLFPAMFYLLFGVLMGSAKGDPHQALYSFATLSVFGAMAPGLFGFGVSLAFEREYGLLVFKQALPMPPGAYLIARMAMAMIFASIIAVLLLVLAKFLGHVPFTFLQVLKVYLIGVLGVLPFCAIGLTVGAFVSGQAAPAIVNLIYLPMAFLSGLWVPLQFLPHVIQEIAPAFPAFHLAQLSLHSLDANSVGTFGSHIASLAGFTIVFFVIAMRRLSNSGLRMFGGGNGVPSGSALPRLLSRAVFFAGIGLIIAGVMGGTVKNAPRDAGGLIGEPAPATPVIANFDDGTAKASYGLGWDSADDKTQGGNSSATVRVIADGAQHSKGALEVTGTIRDGTQYPFAGTMFWPKGSTEESAFVDYSSKHTLKFLARGDGRQYTLLFLIGGGAGGIPPMYSFTAGPDWQEVSVELGTLAGMDLKRVRAVMIGAMAPNGDFRFDIDNVRLE